MKRPKRLVKTPCTLPTSNGNLDFILTRSSSRRTMTIAVDGQSQVKVAVPFLLSERDIHKFIQEKSSWIFAKRKEIQRNNTLISQKTFTDGQHFLFLGEKYPLKTILDQGKRTQFKFQNGRWEVTIPQHIPMDDQEKLIKSKMVTWYREQAKEILGGRVLAHARRLNVFPEKIAVRTQKRLWGSCHHHKKAIFLNWKVILLPFEVIDYIIVHELCHLLVPNHSQRFWSKVKKFYPDFKSAQQWLKENFIETTLPL